MAKKEGNILIKIKSRALANKMGDSTVQEVTPGCLTVGRETRRKYSKF